MREALEADEALRDLGQRRRVLTVRAALAVLRDRARVDGMRGRVGEQEAVTVGDHLAVAAIGLQLDPQLPALRHPEPAAAALQERARVLGHEG